MQPAPAGISKAAAARLARQAQAQPRVFRDDLVLNTPALLRWARDADGQMASAGAQV